MAKAMRRAAPGRMQLNLALQGGGAQGAFTWGVLDRLLEEEDIDIGAISGSSAGALNGAALATGMARGGRAGAREHLAMLWEQVAQAGSLMTLLMWPLRKPGMGVWDDALPILSPCQTNPMGMAPLRFILNTVVDEALLREASAAPRLFVNALHVQSGAGRVFGPADMSIDAVLASACAPLSYQPVVIDGEAYWDGSYAANPSLWPLYEDQLDTDILLVELTPLHRAETPLSAKNILNRINEVASVSGLVSELRALEVINRNVPDADIRMHVLSLPDQPAGLLGTEPSIKRTVGRVLFEMLRQDGRRACDAWLAEHGGQLGEHSTVDVAERYLRPHTQDWQQRQPRQRDLALS
ncbi:MAG: patatin-like phospholipase family protein [Acidovorax sp.]|nr:MAG: patatin-like phospholipase family protein [Acidovorax sp.]